MQLQPESVARRIMIGLSVAYARVFQKGAPFTNQVLADLAKFCYANQTTFSPDPRVAAMLEGRRQVFLRITESLELTPEELFRLRTVQPNQKE